MSQHAACCSFSAASAHLEVLVDDGDGQQDAGAGSNGALRTNLITLLILNRISLKDFVNRQQAVLPEPQRPGDGWPLVKHEDCSTPVKSRSLASSVFDDPEKCRNGVSRSERHQHSPSGRPQW